jgi:hypothetical protein
MIDDRLEEKFKLFPAVLNEPGVGSRLRGHGVQIVFLLCPTIRACCKQKEAENNGLLA